MLQVDLLFQERRALRCDGGPGEMTKPMKRTYPIIIFIILLCALAIWGGCSKEKEPLVVFSGNGLRAPLEELRAIYEQEHGVQVVMIYTGSQTALRALKKSGEGDIYIPGSVRFIRQANHLFSQTEFMGLHVPVVAIHRDNPKNLRSFADLSGPGVKIGLGNEKMNSIGKVCEGMLQHYAGQDALRRNTIIKPPTVMGLVELAAQQKVDAVIIWQDLLKRPEARELTFLPISPALISSEEIHAALLAGSRNSEAPHLLKFLKAEGPKIFARHGFPLQAGNGQGK